MKLASFVAVTVVVAAFSAGPAAAQVGSGADAVRSDTRGLGVGVQFNAAGVASAGAGGTVPGAGLGLTLSYGMTDALSAFVRGSTGYRNSQLDVGARYRFGSPSAALRTYVEGGVTRFGSAAETAEHSTRSWGVGVTAGAGVEYFIAPRLAVDVGVSHTRGAFDDQPVELHGFGSNRDTFTSTRLQVGVTWRP